MVASITLTSSMRSNLSSLKSLASQMSTTQTRLSTGKKVNSAIDNADSYYQARALTNRASDLDMLLDSMGQSIQTITSAIHGLEACGESLSQAAVIANEAYEAAIIPEKAWFEEQVGPNGAVVSTAQELKDAINSGKETVCVYGKIDYFENQALDMKANQKLVGTEYFTGYTGNKKFSEINFSGTQESAIKTSNNCLISDLGLSFTTKNTGSNLIFSTDGVLNNLDLLHNSINSPDGNLKGTIYAYYGEIGTVLHGVINIDSKNVSGNLVMNNTNIEIAEDAVVNINSSNNLWNAIIYWDSQLNIYGKLNAYTDREARLGAEQYSGSSLNIYSGAEVTLRHRYIMFGSQKNDNIYNSILIEKGAKISLNDNYGVGSFISQGYAVENRTTSTKYITSSTLRNSSDFTKIDCDIDWEHFSDGKIGEPADEIILAQCSEQYLTAMNAYDDMISDSSYQGVNLLKGGKLTTMFNEDRTHSYTVEGADMSASGLGITAREWATKDDIAQSIKEIQNAMISIRDEVARLGNHLSIIETRMNFTDGLVDVLQTGADDLVLADMNEESANYLALQTRNNLAVNALALAAQSNNAVLKLF